MEKHYEQEMRGFEIYDNLKVKPNCYFIARLDGKGFSKLTKEMKLKKPFDNNMHVAIVKAIKKLMFETGSVIGYSQSDELSLLFDKSSCFFDRRIEKINSVLPSMMTAFCMEQEFFKNFHPIFDCRILVAQTKKEVFSIFKWRQNDSLRNCLNSYAYWYLRFSGKTERQAEDILKDMKGNIKRELLLKEFDINFKDIKTWEKNGTFVLRERYEKEGFNPKEKKKVLAIRRRFKEVSKEFENSDEFFKEINIIGGFFPS
ncbi:MAG: tRNA(His) guanylyltransferase Thg1 family protein [Nanoarchaeota archaeon]|nr:tRNA(His) guanylyltransferase Thg1 family protein [Nanoarchaeota archaeon]